MIFQKLFGRQDSKESLVSLINSVLQLDEEHKIEDVNVIEQAQQEELKEEDIQGKVDLVAQTKDGITLNVQLQLVNRFNSDKQIIYNWSKLVSNSLDIGQSIGQLNKTISISFWILILLKQKIIIVYFI